MNRTPVRVIGIYMGLNFLTDAILLPKTDSYRGKPWKVL